MANLTLVYGLRLLPSEEVAEVGDATLKLKNGREYFVVFVGPNEFRDLQADTTIINANTQARPREGDGLDKNPLFQDGDLLVYPDEWCSGANFKNLCIIVAKFTNKLAVHVDFLPIALVSASAHEDPRFPHFLKKHEVFVRRVGLDHTEGLFIFPQMRFVASCLVDWSDKQVLTTTLRV